MSSRSRAHPYSSEQCAQVRHDDRHGGYRDDRPPAHSRQPDDAARPAHFIHRHRHRLSAADFVLGHGGRQVRIGPVAFWTIVGTLVIMGGWSLVTATYFAFHDDVLTRLIARQAEMQFAYEDRIAEMRSRVDRVSSRQLLDQAQFERTLEALVKRQSALESRAALIGSVADPTTTGSIKPAARPTSNERAPKSSHGRQSSIAPTLDRLARFESDTAPAIALPRGDAQEIVARLQESLDRIESGQTQALTALENTYEGKLKRLRSAFAELGIDPARRRIDGGVGGPFVPYRPAAHPTTFERQVQRISLARAQADKLSRSLAALPIRQPVVGDIDTSSGFGVRIDPFVGRPAMHTGLDFRGDVGDPVKATAAGTVVSAGRSGGYGNLVEINHGGGLVTRYGHMSAIEVKAGQHVRPGQTVGRLGSTGRSTGPHLHYETRIDGDAVDPQKFLRAGSRLGIGS